ncbi:hypothetical protein ABT160_31140 [Streptomyces sp. NPDC001941]|uniref:hypothetical protein n=1 Tax=Streptomyces sp. NPDC001941 TaxID=3154659 RepID=UPI00331CE04D
MREDQDRDYGSLLMLSMSVLFVEAVLATTTQRLYADTQPSPSMAGSGVPGMLFLPVFLVVGAFFGWVVSHVLVLPAVWISTWLGRRHPAWARWWGPVAVAAVLCLAAVGWIGALAGVREPSTFALTWLVTTLAVAVPALASRSRRPFAAADTALWGTFAALTTAVLGLVVSASGVLPRYHPPTLQPATLVGTWSDGNGGTVTFTRDGTLQAESINTYSLDKHSGTCTGSGTWALGQPRAYQDLTLNFSVARCTTRDWEVGGTNSDITLHHYVGDPDSGHLYELHKR